MNERIEKYQKHIKGLCGVSSCLFDVRLKRFACDQSFCGACGGCDFANTHLYGCYEAQRWGDKYIYYCPKGFIFIAIALSTEPDIMDYGIIAGPILMGEPEKEQLQFLGRVPNLSTKKVNDLTEIMLMVFCNASQLLRQQDHQQAEAILNSVYKVIDRDGEEESQYPIALEKQLKEAIADGSSERARETLNLLLGHIFFYSGGSLQDIKERVLELIVQLSRFSIDCGADIPRMFSLNRASIQEMDRFESIEHLSVWLSSVINRYISYTFEFQEVKHTDTIHKVLQYIKENYMKKITLEDISEHVYLSRAYLSRIFKEEMDISLVNYINKIRVEKSKILLRDHSLSLAGIANLVGFDDQSYFSKVFKSATGMTPGRYRETRTGS